MQKIIDVARPLSTQADYFCVVDIAPCCFWTSSIPITYQRSDGVTRTVSGEDLIYPYPDMLDYSYLIVAKSTTLIGRASAHELSSTDYFYSFGKRDGYSDRGAFAEGTHALFYISNDDEVCRGSITIRQGIVAFTLPSNSDRGLILFDPSVAHRMVIP